MNNLQNRQPVCKICQEEESNKKWKIDGNVACTCCAVFHYRWRLGTVTYKGIELQSVEKNNILAAMDIINSL